MSKVFVKDGEKALFINKESRNPKILSLKVGDKGKQGRTCYQGGAHHYQR